MTPRHACLEAVTYANEVDARLRGQNMAKDLDENNFIQLGRI